MDTLIEGLLKLKQEEENRIKNRMVEAEGADFMEGFANIQKLLTDIKDRVLRRGYILKEDVDLFSEKQMNCIKELGELLDRLDSYE